MKQGKATTGFGRVLAAVVEVGLQAGLELQSKKNEGYDKTPAKWNSRRRLTALFRQAVPGDVRTEMEQAAIWACAEEGLELHEFGVWGCSYATGVGGRRQVRLLVRAQEDCRPLDPEANGVWLPGLEF